MVAAGNIVYQGARIHSSTRIDLQGDARFLGWEILCLGRPAAGERFEFGECRQNFELWRDGEPLYLEQGRYTGGKPVLAAHWGLQGQPASATLLAAGSPPGLVADLRRPGIVGGQARVSVSQLDGVLVCRYLGPSATMARQLLTLAWGLLRPALLDRPPLPLPFLDYLTRARTFMELTPREKRQSCCCSPPACWRNGARPRA